MSLHRFCWLAAGLWMGCQQDPLHLPDAAGVLADASGLELDAEAIATDAQPIVLDAEVPSTLDASVPSDARLPDAVALDATPDSGFEDAATPDSGAGTLVEIPIEGFGGESLGGWQAGHAVAFVTTLADSGPGSLRETLATGDVPTVIKFEVEGTIVLATPLILPSNVTIDGRGKAVRLQGKGLVIPGRHDVIVTGLTIEDVGPNSEDGVQILSTDTDISHDIVLDHLHVLAHGELGSADSMDEGVSVVLGSRRVTVQWSHFENIEKVLLFGNGDVGEDVDGAISVTVHHNWFDRTGRRHPRARFGQFDVYNNFLDHWHRFSEAAVELQGRRTHGVWCHDGCEMIMEANVFSRAPHPNDQGVGVQWPNQASRCSPDPLNAITTGEFGGTIEDRGGYIAADNESPLEMNVGCPAGATVFARPYSAQVDVADESLRHAIEGAAGDW